MANESNRVVYEVTVSGGEQSQLQPEDIVEHVKQVMDDDQNPGTIQVVVQEITPEK